MEAQTFEAWWEELTNLAKQAEWDLGEKEQYKEFFDDGDSPEDALDVDMDV